MASCSWDGKESLKMVKDLSNKDRDKNTTLAKNKLHIKSVP